MTPEDKKYLHASNTGATCFLICFLIAFVAAVWQWSRA